MEPSRVRCVLSLHDGPSRRVGPSGVWIGRQGDCDIVALDPSVSRRHALVRLTGEGAEVVPLGRTGIELNGKRCTRTHALADGDELRVPGLELRVQLVAQRPERGATSGFLLVRARGGSFGVAHTPFQIGGGESDDLIVERWPAHAVAIHIAQGELFVEVHAGSAQLAGHELAEGSLAPLAIGEELVVRGETFRIANTDGRVTTTAVGGSASLPERVSIEMLPRGGRVVFTLREGERAAYLADRRLDLIVALLRPPAGFRAGDFIPDDVVRAIVWPRKPGVTRPEINMLISRCRRELLDIGLAGPRLIERAPGGGATRFALAPDAEIVVQT